MLRVPYNFSCCGHDLLKDNIQCQRGMPLTTTVSIGLPLYSGTWYTRGGSYTAYHNIYSFFATAKQNAGWAPTALVESIIVGKNRRQSTPGRSRYCWGGRCPSWSQDKGCRWWARSCESSQKGGQEASTVGVQAVPCVLVDSGEAYPGAR